MTSLVQPRLEVALREPSEGPRRALNILVAAIGLLLTAPLMAAIAAAIKLTSRGPVFYTQTRIGIDRREPGVPAGNSRRTNDYGGKPFRIYKFCTMRPAQKAKSDEVWARPDDPRVTAVGRILRSYRLDELPQLVNVLLGDMNVVGPRPEQPTIFERLRHQVDRYEQRQRVRPGITGWAQVNQSYDTSVDSVRRKVELDLEYIRRQSVLEDVRILLRTLPVMLGTKGAW
ncbi:MAG TPA: sugar transferase [Gemmatimonadales bacterium]|nr:sugar transferase [Gemmatimonadales bacterium]